MSNFQWYVAGDSKPPLYQSHKQVNALRIRDIKGRVWQPDDDRYGLQELDAAFVEKHNPHVGGYIVYYPDGYESFSPAEAFESGYVMVTDSIQSDIYEFQQAIKNQSVVIVSEDTDKGSRITKKAIEDNIVGEYYFTGADAVTNYVTTDMVSRFLGWKLPDDFSPDAGISFVPYSSPANISWPIGTNLLNAEQAKHMLNHVLAPIPVPEALTLLTFCVLVLKNGFTVTGESYCVSPENFNAEIGRTVARENAIEKIWPLMGYELKSKLSQPSEDC